VTPRSSDGGAKAKVLCPRDGEQIVLADSMVIDDEERVYRFTCPACRLPVEKRFDDGIREVLRSVNVPTLEEVVASETAKLYDDRYVQRALRT
jgi:hypothetical protein